jgi:signal transduction histidine kinase
MTRSGNSSVIAVVLAALAAGATVSALQLASDHRDASVVWALFVPAIGWSFISTGLYVWRTRPERRIGVLMILLGFGWFLDAADAADAPLVYTIATALGGIWGAVFLHLGLSFPTGRLSEPIDRGLVRAGYVIFPFAFVPSLLFAGPSELACDRCPANLLLIESNGDLAAALTAFGAGLYAVLFALVLRRAVGRWRRTGPFERLQLTPVYVCSLLTFALVTVAQTGVGDAAWWAAFVAAGLTPFAFLGGLLRSHVSHLDAELHAKMAELRASRARLVEAGDAARRKLERDLHDGAQSRLVALAMLLNRARGRAKGDHDLERLLDRSIEELRLGLQELRELARGIHPAVLTERGLEPALHSLVARAPLPVTVEAPAGERLPAAVESAAYFVVSEGLANVAKYSQASHATVMVERVDRHLAVEVADDGVGGADAANGSGLRGLSDRIAALDGRLTLRSPAGRGTVLRAEIPV